jgi:CrcB protein
MRGHNASVAPAPDAQVRASVLVVIAVGGALGSLARYGLGSALARPADDWPLATLLVNASGCLLIGALMAVLAARDRPHPLLRPFLGVGVLGGFTTFSGVAVETQGLLRADRPVVALTYYAGTLVAALLAVRLGRAAAAPLARPAAGGRP